ncbi:MAG: VWA domain-containing protein [Cellulomonas sp.]|uniref:carboxypeptidase regulatory-like domain-containing protein n=1 Tax=Cellulomonas sp. TaxID=40001 RepID=UPI00184C38F9|nr:carboxypeptidase regulatory-like domain-containing protein [Cellulomonas sp.]NMM32189.1 VWA domain-containing protein [Cellulomonas sp.]
MSGVLEPDPSPYSRNPDRWIHEFDTLTMDEWYHPTATGHQEESKLLRGASIPGRPTTAAAGSLDLVFVIDATGSMSSLIDQVKAYTTAMVSLLQSSTGSYRFALVTYRDDPTWTGDPGDYAARVDLPFTTDTDAIRAALATMSANGGGDWEETALSGLDTAMSLPWRPGVKKVAVIMGDAPAHNPEPVSGLSSADVIAHSLAVDPVEVFTLSVSGTSLGDSLTDVVDRTGGQLVTATGDVAATLTTTITGALDKPYAWLDGPWTVKVGTTLTLDARGSYAPVGSLVSYAWDLNSDGTTDVTTTSPTLEHLFDTAASTVVSVQVTDDAGRSSMASTRVTITDDGDDIPAASDTCPDVADPAQTDSDGDGTGDACDTTPLPALPASDVIVFGPDELASLSTATLAGTVTDSSGPVAGAAVTVTGADAGGQPASATATSAADGTWRTPGLLPGTYSLTAAGASAARAGSLTVGAGDGSSAGVPDGSVVRSIVLSGIGSSATGYVFTAAAPAVTQTATPTPPADPTATPVAAVITGTPAGPTAPVAQVAGRAPTALSATGLGGLIPLAATSGGLLLVGLLALTVALWYRRRQEG